MCGAHQEAPSLTEGMQHGERGGKGASATALLVGEVQVEQVEP